MPQAPCWANQPPSRPQTSNTREKGLQVDSAFSTINCISHKNIHLSGSSEVEIFPLNSFCSIGVDYPAFGAEFSLELFPEHALRSAGMVEIAQLPPVTQANSEGAQLFGGFALSLQRVQV